MSNKKFGRGFNGKGYYIALILCALAIGISGYLYYRNDTVEQPQLQTPTGNVDVINPTQDDVPAVATDPSELPGGIHDIKPTTPPATLPKPIKTGLPLEGQTIGSYAMDCLSYNPTTRDWRVHDGIDIAAGAGTPVHAAAEGTVTAVYEDDAMGCTVEITHVDGYVTSYSSLEAPAAVAVGDTVTLGQAIGTVGNTALLETATGDHLHFSVSCNGVVMDPELFFQLG